MKLWTVINLWWIFWGFKSFASAQWPDATEEDTRLNNAMRLLEKRQDASMMGGLGAQGAGGFGNMMGGNFGNMAGMGGGAFPGGAAMGNAQSAGGMMQMQGFNANPFAMGGAAGFGAVGGVQGVQGVPQAPFANTMVGAQANPLMAPAPVAQGFGGSPMMNGFGGMDAMQQMGAPRFSPPALGGGMAGMGGMGGGFGAAGMGMNVMNGGGMGMGNMGNMGNMGGMGAPAGGAGFAGMPNAGGAMGFGGGFQQNMGPQFINRLHKRWSKAASEEQSSPNSAKVPLSTVIEELKAAAKNTNEDEIDTQEATSCGGCIPLDLRKITGSWTQIYGNPESLRLSYTALSAFQASHDSDDGSQNGVSPVADPRINDTSIQPACIGFHFERPFPRRVSDVILGEAPVNLHFRDDHSYRQYQVSGSVQQSLVPNQSEVRIRVSSTEIPMCLVKGAPGASGDYDYVILMETRGPRRCKALHVIARNSDSFFQKYSSDVIEYLQQKVQSGEAGTVKIMPNPEQCEPRQQEQWQAQQQQEREGASL